MKQRCVDKFVGAILAGWRYDISGITPEMRGDYEQHFRDCEHCRYWRTVHRTIDVALIWVIVAVATPAPMAMADAARLGARAVHDRLPPEIRERIPEELRLKISG